MIGRISMMTPMFTAMPWFANMPMSLRLQEFFTTR